MSCVLVIDAEELEPTLGAVALRWAVAQEGAVQNMVVVGEWLPEVRVDASTARLLGRTRFMGRASLPFGSAAAAALGVATGIASVPAMGSVQHVAMTTVELPAILSGLAASEAVSPPAPLVVLLSSRGPDVLGSCPGVKIARRAADLPQRPPGPGGGSGDGVDFGALASQLLTGFAKS